MSHVMLYDPVLCDLRRLTEAAVAAGRAAFLHPLSERDPRLLYYDMLY